MKLFTFEELSEESKQIALDTERGISYNLSNEDEELKEDIEYYMTDIYLQECLINNKTKFLKNGHVYSY